MIYQLKKQVYVEVLPTSLMLKTMQNITPAEIRTIKPMDIHLNYGWTHISRKWWHRFMFWKKFSYAEDSFMIASKRMSIEELLGDL